MLFPWKCMSKSDSGNMYCLCNHGDAHKSSIGHCPCPLVTLKSITNTVLILSFTQERKNSVHGESSAFCWPVHPSQHQCYHCCYTMSSNALLLRSMSWKKLLVWQATVLHSATQYLVSLSFFSFLAIKKTVQPVILVICWYDKCLYRTSLFECTSSLILILYLLSFF